MLNFVIVCNKLNKKNIYYSEEQMLNLKLFMVDLEFK